MAARHALPVTDPGALFDARWADSALRAAARVQDADARIRALTFLVSDHWRERAARTRVLRWLEAREVATAGREGRG